MSEYSLRNEPRKLLKTKQAISMFGRITYEGPTRHPPGMNMNANATYETNPGSY